MDQTNFKSNPNSTDFLRGVYSVGVKLYWHALNIADDYYYCLTEPPPQFVMNAWNTHSQHDYSSVQDQFSSEYTQSNTQRCPWYVEHVEGNARATESEQRRKYSICFGSSGNY